MAERSPIFQRAHNVSIVGCNLAECRCGQVHIRFHDETDAIFAQASFLAVNVQPIIGDLEAEVAKVLAGPVAGNA